MPWLHALTQQSFEGACRRNLDPLEHAHWKWYSSISRSWKIFEWDLGQVHKCTLICSPFIDQARQTHGVEECCTSYAPLPIGTSFFCSTSRNQTLLSKWEVNCFQSFSPFWKFVFATCSCADFDRTVVDYCDEAQIVKSGKRRQQSIQREFSLFLFQVFIASDCLEGIIKTKRKKVQSEWMLTHDSESPMWYVERRGIWTKSSQHLP